MLSSTPADTDATPYDAASKPHQPLNLPALSAVLHRQTPLAEGTYQQRSHSATLFALRVLRALYNSDVFRHKVCSTENSKYSA